MITRERLAELREWASQDWCAYAPATPDELLELIGLAEQVDELREALRLACRLIVDTRGDCPGDMYAWDHPDGGCGHHCDNSTDDTETTCAKCYATYYQQAVTKPQQNDTTTEDTQHDQG